MTGRCLLAITIITVVVPGCRVTHVDACPGRAKSWRPAGPPSPAAVATAICHAGLPCSDGDEGPPSCAEHQDCPPGSFCSEQAGKCLASDTCREDRDCGKGLTCDEERVTCVPGEDPPAPCEDLASEASCAARDDCEPIYAGVNCACGPDCVCTGNEPNCQCERFDYFVCGVSQKSAPAARRAPARTASPVDDAEEQQVTITRIDGSGRKRPSDSDRRRRPQR